MTLPDGWIYQLQVTNKGTAIKVEQTDLVLCKHCKYALIGSVVPLVVCENPNGLVYPRLDTFCSYGELEGEE